MTDTRTPASSIGERPRRCPLPDGVVCPGTVFTLALESEAARAAVPPHRPPTAGCSCWRGRRRHRRRLPACRTAAAMPTGEMAAIVQAEVRARIVQPLRRASAAAIRSRSSSLADARPTPACRSRHPRAARRARGDRQAAPAAGACPRSCAPSPTRRQLADAVTDVERRRSRPPGRRLRAARPREPRRAGHDVGQGAPRRAAGDAQIRDDVTEGVDKQQREYLLRQQLAAIRKELGEGDDDVVERVPRQARRRSRCPRTCATASTRRSTGWSARASSRPSSAGSAHGSIASSNCRGAAHRRPARPRPAHERCSTPITTASTKSRTASSSSSPCASCAHDRDVASPTDGGPATRGRRRHPDARRAARRRQDQPRRVRGPGDGPQVRARLPRRRPRRGRDPWPPPNLRRQPAWSYRPGDHRGGLDEPGRCCSTRSTS